jgi:hypothetical protein
MNEDFYKGIQKVQDDSMKNGGGLLDADALASHISIYPESSVANSNTNVVKSRQGKRKAGESKKDGETSKALSSR